MPSKKNVIVLGTLGVGKSTLMNRIAGVDKFVTSDGAEGCTQLPLSYTFKKDGVDITVTDTPGTNDPDMDIATWIAGFRKEAEK